MTFKKMLTVVFAGILIAVSAVGVVLANHNPAIVSVSAPGACGATTISGTVTDPAGTHKVGNMYLVVYADGVTQSNVIPVDGSSVSLSVGPFYTNDGAPETIQWHVFGGGERSYDIPLWHYYGEADFGTQIADYADSVGGSFSWVVAGPDDPNPFVTWTDVSVNSCAITKDMCKNGGWQAFGFSNQGQCIRFVNTGQDSR